MTKGNPADLNPTYLGDGVYLSQDGYQLWLGVGDHNNQSVALDYRVFKALIERGTAMYAAMVVDLS